MAKEKVIVAMSGGVDSSVTAALLLDKGYDVTGITMQIWDPEQTEVDGDFVGCCSLSAVDDARRVARDLGIDYYVLNFRSFFEKTVINNFITEYLRGRTPNPCVICNRRVKFESLLNKALALGAQYVATGHYARLGFDSGTGRYVIRKARDAQKDQTYFLYPLTQKQIAHTLMPLGDFNKEEVRELAARKGLAVAEKPESQEICFVNGRDYHGFVREHAGTEIKPGPFLDLDGNVLGQHKGIPFYTVGQRRGLGLATGEKVYVVDIDPGKNTVTVGPARALDCRELVAEDNNFILWENPEEKMDLEAQIRYNSKPFPAIMYPLGDNKVKIRFKEPQRAVTPGQAVVYYKGDLLLGGGTILKRSG